MPGSRLRRARSARCMRDGLKTHSVQNRFTMYNEVFNIFLRCKSFDLPRIKVDRECEFQLLGNQRKLPPALPDALPAQPVQPVNKLQDDISRGVPLVESAQIERDCIQSNDCAPGEFPDCPPRKS